MEADDRAVLIGSMVRRRRESAAMDFCGERVTDWAWQGGTSNTSSRNRRDDSDDNAVTGHHDRLRRLAGTHAP